MTLTEYEASLVPLGYMRFPAAGAALRLRELTDRGEAFIAARDRIVSMRAYREPLKRVEQLTVFAALTGP
jgi:hypothetical protein